LSQFGHVSLEGGIVQPHHQPHHQPQPPPHQDDSVYATNCEAEQEYIVTVLLKTATGSPL
jgi:hypothetical protein